MFERRRNAAHHIKETGSIDSLSSPTEETPVGSGVRLGKGSHFLTYSW